MAAWRYINVHNLSTNPEAVARAQLRATEINLRSR
jgi:hypothetical protein